MIRVNLLAGGGAAAVPRKSLVPAEQRTSLIGLGMLFITILTVGGWWYYLDRQRAATEEGITTAEARIEQLKDAMKLLEESRARKAELQERLALIDRLRNAKHAPVRMLYLLNASLPDGLWLMEVKQAAASVTIEGRAMSPSAITDFAETLQLAGFFKMPVEIVTTTLEAVDDSSVYRFVLKAEPVAGDPLTPPTTAVTTPAAAGRPGV